MSFISGLYSFRFALAFIVQYDISEGLYGKMYNMELIWFTFCRGADSWLSPQAGQGTEF